MKNNVYMKVEDERSTENVFVRYPKRIVDTLLSQKNKAKYTNMVDNIGRQLHVVKIQAYDVENGFIIIFLFFKWRNMMMPSRM